MTRRRLATDDALWRETLTRPAPPARRLRRYVFGIVIIILAALILFDRPAPADLTSAPSVGYKVVDDPDAARYEKYQQQLANELDRARIAREGDDLPAAPTTIELPPRDARHVRVAAAQIYPLFGNLKRNTARIENAITRAAALGAQIVVFPEAALSGYADLDNWSFWAIDEDAAEQQAESGFFFDVKNIALTADSGAVRYCRDLAKLHQLYVALPYIERGETAERYYDSLSLINPEGEIIAHYRKQRLTETMDTFWAAAGEPAVVTATPFGRIGLLIGYDLLAALPDLTAQKADLVLHAAAFSGANVEKYLRTKYREHWQSAHCAVVLANWGITYTPAWEGYGYSRLLDRNGNLLAAARADEYETLVIADLPLPAPE